VRDFLTLAVFAVTLPGRFRACFSALNSVFRNRKFPDRHFEFPVNGEQGIRLETTEITPLFGAFIRESRRDSIIFPVNSL